MAHRTNDRTVKRRLTEVVAAAIDSYLSTPAVLQTFAGNPVTMKKRKASVLLTVNGPGGTEYYDVVVRERSWMAKDLEGRGT